MKKYLEHKKYDKTPNPITYIPIPAANRLQYHMIMLVSMKHGLN